MLQFYYGQECPHCDRMQVFLNDLESGSGKLFDRIEVWHHDGSMKKLEEIDRGRCGGVPYFYNPKTDDFLCGEVKEKELENWIRKQAL